MEPRMIELEDNTRFILAGNAYFTVVNEKSGNRFTYRVSICKNNDKLHFVSVLTAPDNEEGYTYLGIIRDGERYYHGVKSRIGEEAPSAVAFRWVWDHLSVLPACVKVYHQGKCGRCGRKLTVPESILSGFGPECRAA